MPPDKIKITNLQTNSFFYVSFNPEEYSLNKDNNYASQSIPGLESPLLQFVAGNLQTLDMELFFDTFEAQTDVRDQTKNVTDLLTPDPDLHAPPVLLVSWGTLQFQCVLAKVAQKFVKFLPSGIPARARLTVTFNEYKDAVTQVKELNLQTADFSKVHTATFGETLSGLAGDYYENALLWRPIALANNMADPRTLTPGQQLLVPSLPYVDPASGEVIQ